MTAKFSLPRRLRAGETVYSGWCRLAMPLIGELLARHGFTAVTSTSSTASSTSPR